VFDCFGGEIVSLAMANNMKKELCIEAIKVAFKTRKPQNGIVIHSDAGSQYTSDAYKATLGSFHAIQRAYHKNCVNAQKEVRYEHGTKEREERKGHHRSDVGHD
jgi:transposase InsO family protein